MGRIQGDWKAQDDQTASKFRAARGASTHRGVVMISCPDCGAPAEVRVTQALPCRTWEAINSGGGLRHRGPRGARGRGGAVRRRPSVHGSGRDVGSNEGAPGLGGEDCMKGLVVTGSSL